MPMRLGAITMAPAEMLHCILAHCRFDILALRTLHLTHTSQPLLTLPAQPDVHFCPQQCQVHLPSFAWPSSRSPATAIQSSALASSYGSQHPTLKRTHICRDDPAGLPSCAAAPQDAPSTLNPELQTLIPFARYLREATDLGLSASSTCLQSSPSRRTLHPKP